MHAPPPFGCLAQRRTATPSPVSKLRIISCIHCCLALDSPFPSLPPLCGRLADFEPVRPPRGRRDAFPLRRVFVPARAPRAAAAFAYAPCPPPRLRRTHASRSPQRQGHRSTHLPLRVPDDPADLEGRAGGRLAPPRASFVPWARFEPPRPAVRRPPPPPLFSAA